MDAIIANVSAVVPHPNADRLDIVSVLGYQCVSAKGAFVEGDRVVYVAPDAAIDTNQPWLDNVVATYLGSGGRVKTIKLRGAMSEGLLFSPDIFTEEQLTAIAEGRAEDVGITHYSPPEKISRNSAIGNVASNVRSYNLPFGLTKTDQDNVQEIPWCFVTNRHYIITKKMDGTSCTIAIHSSKKAIEGENYFSLHNGERWSFDIHVCSRNLDLKITMLDSVYTKVGLPIALKMCDEIATLGIEGVVILRGEICGEGINTSKPNKDAQGEATFHAFELFTLEDGAKCQLNVFNDERPFRFVPCCKRLGTVSVHNTNYYDVIVEYLDAPADKYGEGVVFWEYNGTDTPYSLSGYSFKVKSRDYYSQL